MARIIFLGTANAIPDEYHENTYLVYIGSTRKVLVDCGNTPLVRLQKAQIDPTTITDVILTHFHPDHAANFIPFLMGCWLLGRKSSLAVHGSEYTLSRVESTLQLYKWTSWPDMYPVHFHILPDQERQAVLEDAEVMICASPVCHMVPNIGLRIEDRRSGKVVVYSGDTEPCPAVTRLAQAADILIHESNGAGVGHTSASQAAQIAVEAGVHALYLIHYPVRGFDMKPEIAAAQALFTGQVTLTADLMEIGL